jgi:hypothetical protein
VGDIVHVAAVQFEHPSVTIGCDVDAAEAEREHLLQLAEAAQNGHLIDSRGRDEGMVRGRTWE